MFDAVEDEGQGSSIGLHSDSELIFSLLTPLLERLGVTLHIGRVYQILISYQFNLFDLVLELAQSHIVADKLPPGIHRIVNRSLFD